MIIACLLLISVAAYWLLDRLDRRPPDEVITFSDWWREVKIIILGTRADMTTDPYLWAYLMVKRSELLMARKRVMWDHLRGDHP